MGRFWTFVLLALIAFGAWRHFTTPGAGQPAVHHNRVIMYSLTTCGNCKHKKQELLAAGIPFEEYYVDKEPARNGELNAKLAAVGISTAWYGMPVLDVHGSMLPNNPSMADIRAHL